MSEGQLPDDDDPGWIDFPPGWPAELGRPRGASPTDKGQTTPRPQVVVGSPIRPLGGGERRRVERVTPRG